MSAPFPPSAPVQGADAPLTALDRLRLEMLSSLETYTRVMFRQQYNTSFVVASHHRQMFRALQDVVDGKTRRLIINMPPRYSKTEVVVKQFVSWCFALNASARFLHLSYSDLLVNDNSGAIRDAMRLPLYKELFPSSALEREKGGTSKWKTQRGGEMYAVSTQGQVTGFGAGRVTGEDPGAAGFPGGGPSLWAFPEDVQDMLMLLEADANIFQGAILIDDPLKPEDALSDIVRERINQRFENTIRNRVNSRNTPIVIIMQRLHEHDLCGYLMEKEPDEWTVLSLPAISADPETGEEQALWPMKHTLQELRRMRELDPVVFDTQYIQDPTPREGLMYPGGFEEYAPEELDQYKPSEVRTLSYTDTADTGADSLCSIVFTDTPEFIYVKDVVYTQEPMEVTEPLTARTFHSNKVSQAWIESNNGGRGFARNVVRLLKRRYLNFRCVVHWFHQGSNKYERIFSCSASAQAVVRMPKGWKKKWPKFAEALLTYRKDNRRRSQHDDAPDALTGCVEIKMKGAKKSKIKRRN